MGFCSRTRTVFVFATSKLRRGTEKTRLVCAETLFLVDALNMIETLGNLNHLIRADAGDVGTVQLYVSQVDDVLRRFAALVRSRCNR